MWHKIANFIIKYRLYLLVTLVALTAFMAYVGQYAKWTYEILKTVPEHDPEIIYFRKFQNTFGEDGNMMAIFMRDSSVYRLKNFRKLSELTDDINKIEGVTRVVSLANMLYLYANKEAKKFESKKLFEHIPHTQYHLDSILLFINKVKIYENRLINKNNGAMLMIVSIDDDYLNSSKRQKVVKRIVALGRRFSFDTNIKIHYAGLPFVRSFMDSWVKSEAYMFLAFSIVMTILVMYLFFRSFSTAFFPLLLVGIMLLWLKGIVFLLGFKITVFIALLQTILVVISIPNCIYLLNRYHQEFMATRNKREAIYRTIRKIGVITMLTNSTTAIGFFVLVFTDIRMLQEFGIVATISIISTFFISIIFIPSIFLYLPSPKERHTRHLHFKPTNYLINQFQMLINKRSNWIFAISVLLSGLAFIGSMQLKALTYMVDDLPKETAVMKDLVLFEENFGGIMPLEIIINTGKPKGIRKSSALKKVDKIEEYLSELPEVTAPLSFATFIKSANQAYNNYNEYSFKLPSSRERPFIYRYLKNSDTENPLTDSFIDSTEQYLRVSMQVADLGSEKINTLVNQEIRPRIDDILIGSKMAANVTGTTIIFSKSNYYLINNLKTTMFIAFALIAAVMGFLFKNVRIVIISLIPNFVPLLATAGVMGFLEVPLKPSTVLVFSIAFGISVDDSIHFLAKYKQELVANSYRTADAIRISLQQTGMSMLYTSIVLFSGFVIFTFSDFGGTVALGALSSFTLLLAMLTNLTLLPALLRVFDREPA